MSWDSILGFIVLIGISSLFNRMKNQNTHPRNDNSPGPMVAPRKVNPPRPTAQPNRSANRQEPKGRRSLEEMLRELQNNMQETFNQYVPKEESPQKAETPVEEKVVGTKPKPQRITFSEIQELDPITSGEIGKRTLGNIKFNRQSMIQGIIMTEILGKPKSKK